MQPDFLIKLGLKKISDNSYYKEVENPISFNYAKFQIFGGSFLSIIVGKKDQDYQRTLLKGYYVQDEQELLKVLSKMLYLSNIFPEIVCVPELDKSF